MPKRVQACDAKAKWNFYFPQLLKLEMHKKLLDHGYQGKQSALLRSLVRLYVEGDIQGAQLDKLGRLIDEETYITDTDKVSKL